MQDRFFSVLPLLTLHIKPSTLISTVLTNILDF
nr:MAG TPA: hypothetical protein [Caudoviricetes sp.]